MFVIFFDSVNLTMKFKFHAAVVSKLSKILLALLSLPFYRVAKVRAFILVTKFI